MSKKEKYINYIVDDVIKNTEIDYEKASIKFPFMNPPFTFHSLYQFFHPLTPFSLSIFSKYATDMYGVRDEELEIIWKQFKERIQQLIK